MLSPPRSPILHDIPNEAESISFCRGAFHLRSFKRIPANVWSIIPSDASCTVKSGVAIIHVSPVSSLNVIAIDARIVRSCDCCVTLGEWQLSTDEPSSTNSPSSRNKLVSPRDRFVSWLRSHGAVFEDRELFARCRHTGECMQSVYVDEPTKEAISPRSPAKPNHDDINVDVLLNKDSGVPVALLKRHDPRKLWNELRTLIVSFGNPCIVDFIGAFRAPDGSLAVATKLTPYGDLYTALSNRTFTSTEASAICQQILKGAAHLHAHKIVARDIKPENILVLDPECKRVCLTDLHFAISTDEPDFQRERCGTLGYCAPELLKLHTDKTTLTEKVDCWSIGSTFFDLITGQSLCRADQETLEEVNGSVTVELQDTVVLFRIGVKQKRKWKIDAKDAMVAEVLAGLMDPDPIKRLSANDAIQLLERVLNKSIPCD